MNLKFFFHQLIQHTKFAFIAFLCIMNIKAALLVTALLLVRMFASDSLRSFSTTATTKKPLFFARRGFFIFSSNKPTYKPQQPLLQANYNAVLVRLRMGTKKHFVKN